MRETALIDRFTMAGVHGYRGRKLGGLANLHQDPPTVAETVHLQNYGQPDGTALCGAQGRTMSHHELKRGRITCPACITAHARQ